MTNKQFGQRLREQRRQQNLTIEQLAEKIGVSRNFLGLVERGEKTPSMDTLLKIIDALDISADALLCDQTAHSEYIDVEVTRRFQGLSPQERTAALRLLDNFLDSLRELRKDSKEKDNV